MNLKLMLEEAVGRYKGKPAIVSSDRRLSFTDLDEASNKVANALIKLGVNKGDRVATLLDNGPEFVTTYFGIVKTGAIAVPLDAKFKVDELASLFDDCRPKVLVTESPTLEPLIPVLSKFKSISHVIDLSSKFEGQFLSYNEIMATGSPQGIEVALEPDDAANIMYTSGPAFHPKGTVLSHQRLVAQGITAGNWFQQTEKDIELLFALPIHHTFGLASVLLASITKGSTLVILPGVSIPGLTEIIERSGGTVLIGVPFIYTLMVGMAEEEGIKHDLSSMRLYVCGGAPLPIDIIKRFRKYYGVAITQGWGLTESIAHVTCQPIDGSGEPGSVGKAMPGWTLKVVDDNGRELPPTRNGEVLVSGPIMKGYYNNPQATAEHIKGGWLYTGDIGKVDEEGNLFITGRKKDLIIVKGQNICPIDIETVLLKHPKVAEAAVIGIPDELRGEIVGAVISLKPEETIAEQEIRHLCLEHMANYKVPKQIVFLDSLPKTTDGTIDKQKIKEYLSIPSLFPEIAIS